MATIILIISGVLFISTFGIHSTIKNGNEIDKANLLEKTAIQEVENEIESWQS